MGIFSPSFIDQTRSLGRLGRPKLPGSGSFIPEGTKPTGAPTPTTTPVPGPVTTTGSTGLSVLGELAGGAPRLEAPKVPLPSLPKLETPQQPAMVAAPRSGPVLTVSGPEAPQMTTRAPVAPAAPITTQEAPAAPTTPPGSPGTSPQGVYDSVLSQLAEGIQGNQPLPGTQAAITQRREALAQYAKSAEARAGMAAARSGAIGQGTAIQAAQGTRSDILSQLADAEMENVKAVSSEKQALLDKAIQAGQFGQTMDQNKAQFRETMDQRKVEFEKTFGASESGKYLNQLERMAVDNPVLAAKLTDYLLQGKTGAVGEFSAEEKGQIQKYLAEKKGTQDKLTDAMTAIIGAIPGQIEAGNKVTIDAQKKAEEEARRGEVVKKLNSLPAGQFLPDEEFKLLEANQDVPRYSVGSLPTGASAQPILGKIVSIDGAQYRVVSADTVTTSYKEKGIMPDERGHTSYVQVIDANGKTYYVYGGKLNAAAPKKDSNPY